MPQKDTPPLLSASHTHTTQSLWPEPQGSSIIDSKMHFSTGHGKSVSYVRYMSPDSIVSASTDSTLRAWSRQEKLAVRTYTGHLNCKNFVGLAADGEFLATGSETSEVGPTLLYLFEWHSSLFFVWLS